MPLTIGTRLGPYEVVGFLGAGGMGEVYRANDTRLGRTVAIKVLPEALAADAERRRRFLQEARSASALSHPHICALYDLGSENGTDFLVMEYLEGQTLAERLASGGRKSGKSSKGGSGVASGECAAASARPGQPLPLAETLEYAVQIADALAKAHRQGVVHRDIKPANVMLTKEGAKLLDFGLAKSRTPVATGADLTASLTREPSTSVGVVVGTVPYMAPEQLEGRDADARTDIFAFGAVLYEMVSGRRAFEESSSASLIAAIMTRDPEPLATIVPVTPPSLDRLVRQCLAKDPDKRWQSAGDLARQLEWIAEEVRTPRSGQVSVEPAARVAGRRRSRIVAAALAGLVLIGIVAGAFLMGRRAADQPMATFKRLTFRRGAIDTARFTPDGQNVFFTARWDGDPREVLSLRLDSVDAILREGLQGMNFLAVSKGNELALLRGVTLAKAPLAGGAPREFASGISSADWSPDGSQLAVTTRAGTFNTVEYPVGTVIYKTSQTASDVRISPRGDLLAFREHSQSHGYMVVIDTAGHKKVQSPHHDGLLAPAWTPDGREVWFTVSVPHGRIPIVALDLSGRERNVLTHPTFILKDISRDGRVLLSAEDQTYSINARAPGSVTERNLTWYNWSLLDDMSSDGRTVLFTEGGESDPQNGWSSFMRSTDGAPPQRFDDLIYAMLSPDRKWLAGLADAKDGFQIKVTPTGAGQGRLVTRGPEGHTLVGWLADSSGIVYWVHNPAKPEAPDRVWLATLDGRPPTAITPDGWFGIGMGPDATHVLAQTSAPGDPRMFLFSLDGREKILLPGVSDNNWVPIGWDADGKRMRALPNRLAMPLRIFRVDPMTGDAQPWKELGGQLDRAGLNLGVGNRRVMFSTDGESYAYSYSRRLSTLYVVEGLQ